ncbi:alpha/beta hydrolase [Sphingomonas sp. CGMCC 1.13654]|uniref:Alpha/beta hydrolase n=1 Tax=Sphingomonas chungangi TaxID=2683589 RepID=A0A838L2X6_9SPHN|nr:alpha/beta hydrolase [Sphingomonas chungangi]MBA2933843.1 alpha/beta hydrolase [Sphingomonas chungangi]MVW55173.1 alpha/beta fold hydrolase [Sphingomonas chungangi]
MDAPNKEDAGLLHVRGAGGVRLAMERLAPAVAPRIAILFLHGGGQSRHSWRQTARALAKAGHPCWLADLRGHGDSDWAPDGDYSLDAFRDDISALTSAIDAPVLLVGGSQGGVSAILAAGETRHHAIRGVVMVDIAARTTDNPVIFDFMRAAEKGFASIDEAARLVAGFAAGAGSSDPDRLARNLRTRPDGRLGWHWDPRYVGPRAMEEAKERRARLESLAGRVDVPVLVLRGSDSPVLDMAAARDYAARLPRGEAEEIAGAGHMVTGDLDGAFSGAIAAFVARAGIA